MIRQLLIDKAKAQYVNIKPCGNKLTLNECFTSEMGRIQFWFNVDQDGSTRMIEDDNGTAIP